MWGSTGPMVDVSVNRNRGNEINTQQSMVLECPTFPPHLKMAPLIPPTVSRPELLELHWKGRYSYGS